MGVALVTKHIVSYCQGTAEQCCNYSFNLTTDKIEYLSFKIGCAMEPYKGRPPTHSVTVRILA